MTFPERTVAAISMVLCASVAWCQPRASACFLEFDFTTVDQFSGWDIGPFVETQDPEGQGLGDLVPAWEIMDAEQANADGFFPVANVPLGNRFVAANDAAAPCNCAMEQVALTTPLLDLTDRFSVGLQFRVFNERTFGAGDAILEIDRGDSNWQLLDTLPVGSGQWLPVFVDLSAFDNEPQVRLRFRWSDGGGWASGFAFDDLCFSERLGSDLTLLKVYPNDQTISPFIPSDQSLGYRALPLEQAGPITLVALVENNGTTVLMNVVATAMLDLNGIEEGPYDSAPLDSLVPGERHEIRIQTNWTPDALGELGFDVAVGSDSQDEDEDDNTGSATLLLTGAGWSAGNGAMALDEGSPDGSFIDSSGYILANRMELINAGSIAEGMSVRLSEGTSIGSVVRGILFDANFSFLDSTERHTVSQADLDAIYSGAPLYLPFSARPVLPAGDVFVGAQHVSSNNGNQLGVAYSGSATLGASVLLEGFAFDQTYLLNTPMVVLYLEQLGVAVQEVSESTTAFKLYPNPTNDALWIKLSDTAPGKVELWIWDVTGSLVAFERIAQMTSEDQTYRIDVAHLASGTYVLGIGISGSISTSRLQVVH